jgi:adenylate cyclase
MIRITYLNEKTVQTDEATPILHASLQNGIPHTHVCGGNARCSTCRVLILEGLENCCPRNEREQKMAERRKFSPTVRLACQTTLTGDVTLRRLVLDEEDRHLVDDEVRDGASPRSVGEERPLAILFSDIRNFTPFAESQLPYDVIHVLNRYFHRMGGAVERNRGQIDNFVGDGLSAFFGLADPARAVLDAVQAGLDMLAELEAMQPYFQALFRSRLSIGIGVHYGEVVLGAVGVGERRRLTMVGDAANFASRVESATKEAGVPFLISQDAYEQARGRAQVGRQFDLAIKGKSGTYSLYEVLGLDQPQAAA